MDSTKATAANGIEQRAKLEQELESIIDHWCETGGQSVIELMNDLRPIVAAALAACAREEELRVARTIKRRLGEFYYVTKDSSSRAKNFEDWLNEHVAALERAAGESK